MNIIVTGGAGFIGSNFVFYMLEKHPEDRIICVDSLTYAGNLSTLESVMDHPQFRFVKLDIRDREGVDRLFAEEKPEVVVNFAAESHVDRSIENPGIFLETNIMGTAVLMDADPHQQPVQHFEGFRRSACSGIPQDLRPSCDDQQMLQ